MDNVVTTKPIVKRGGSLTVSITDICQMMGLNEGDMVEMEIRRSVKHDGNGDTGE